MYVYIYIYIYMYVYMYIYDVPNCMRYHHDIGLHCLSLCTILYIC